MALGAGTVMVGQHAAALLAGRFTREVSRRLLDLGFDTVDIHPELLAREGDPSARFIFGKQVSPSLRLVYSIGLNDPEAHYYQASSGSGRARGEPQGAARGERHLYLLARPAAAAWAGRPAASASRSRRRG